MRRPSHLAVLASLLLVCAPASAGLFFQRVPAPEGADVAALAGDGTRLWAATIRGVWKLEAGQWSLDGPGDRTLTSVAVAAGTPFAADGTSVYRRNADGSWTAEALPTSGASPSLLAASGTTLFAAGIGAFRRDAGTWTALPPPPGGAPRAITVTDSGDLVLGFADGTAARFSNGAWTTLAGGIGIGETIQALTSFGGLLWAGTNKAVYSQLGTTWSKDASFPTHDVRALTGANGTLRAATADAGVFRKSGASWIGESASFLTFFTKAFGTSGSDLYVGTGGGPVYRLVSGSWSETKSGLDAAIVTDIGIFPPQTWVTTSGAGAVALGSGGAVAAPVPPGCGDLVGASEIALPAHPVMTVLLSNPCGAVITGASPSAVTSGLPAGVRFTAFAGGAAFPQALASTSANGVWLFNGFSWNALNSGLSDGASVQTIRTFLGGSAFSKSFAGIGGAVALLGQSGWSDVSDGLPGNHVLSIGARVGPNGLTSTFAGLAAGGVYRRTGAGLFDFDGAGIATSAVFSLEDTAQGLAAAAGVAGVRVKRGGGWVPESFGLPAGADVRVVRATSGAGQGIFAGTAGSGLFFAATDPSLRTIPVVLDVVGGTGAHFRTELTIGNRGVSAATVHVTFAPTPGFGAPQVAAQTATTTLAPGTELRAADALDWLRAAGLAIPAASGSSPIAGSLSIAADGSLTDSLYAIARTYTSDVHGGTYGLFYDAPSDLEAAENEGFVYGLRSVSNVSRSNLAMVHLPGRSAEPITLAVQVYADNGTAAGAPIDVILAPGEWRQLNGVLGLAGLADGAFGYARITRTSGIGPWSAYGVVNDAKTSDGSYLPLFRPGGVTAARRLLVPVVLDVFGAAGSHFTTELTLVNDGSIATPVDLFYQPAPGAGAAPGVPYVTVPLAARQQLTIPDVMQYLRDHGVHVPSPSSGAQVGTLEVSFRFLGNLDAPRTVALARTSTPNPDASAGGAFGLFYPAIAEGAGARTTAIVPALTEDANVRSNLAVVHAGGGSGLPMSVSIQLHDASSGAPVGHPITATLNPGDWVQYSKVLSVAGAAPATTRAYAVVTRTAGDDTFYAYGVLNDNVTSDGSFLPMIPSERD